MAPKNRRPGRPALALTRPTLPSVLEYFRTLRERRGDLTSAELRALHRQLTSAAGVLYRLADRVERDTRVRVPRRPLDDLADQVARIGPAEDPVTTPIRATVAELRKRLRDRWSAPVRELRYAAMRLMDLADDVWDARDAPEHPRMRRRAPARVGRPRNRILERILDLATKWGIRDAVLARALADIKFLPDGPASPQADLEERWAAIIKSARARRRRRARGEHR